MEVKSEVHVFVSQQKCLLVKVFIIEKTLFHEAVLPLPDSFVKKCLFYNFLCKGFILCLTSKVEVASQSKVSTVVRVGVKIGSGLG